MGSSHAIRVPGGESKVIVRHARRSNQHSPLQHILPLAIRKYRRAFLGVRTASGRRGMHANFCVDANAHENGDVD